MSHLELIDIDLAFGRHKVVRKLSLKLEKGRIGCLLGPSGCGKTTVLRCIAGFEALEAGEIRLDGATVSAKGIHVAPERRRIGMVFQDYALFPHLTVADNIAFGLRNEGAETRRERVAELLGIVGLGDQGTKYPHELSGGQQQRVALARALAPRPSLLLLDEPFSNLDASLRDRVRAEVRGILRAAGVTALIVTHDQEEALSLADSVWVMREGRIEQSGRPEEVYGSPASRWVAEFLGEIDVLPGDADGAVAQCALGRVPVPAGTTGPVDVLVRPESVSLGTHRDHGEHQAVVVERTFYGHDQLVTVELAGGMRLRSRSIGFPAWHPGDRLWVSLTGPVTVLRARG
jgi:iron(III) transport system ATP-binding protein